MEQYFFLALGTCGMVLQVMVIYAITRSSLRRFGGFFFYVLILFLTSVADMAAFLDWASDWPEWYRNYYYLNNTLRHFAGFVAVISLIYTAASGHSQRLALGMKLLVGTLIMVAGSFLISSGEPYMAQVGRNLSFATLVLNMVLWLSLIKVREQDRRLFLASGGLGLNMAGEAISNALFQLSQSVSFVPGLIGVGSHLLCLFIWWRAFRRAEQRPPVADPVA